MEKGTKMSYENTFIGPSVKMPKIKSTSSDIVSDLLQNNLCNYCCLRFINNKSIEDYKNVDDRVKQLLEEGNFCEIYIPLAKKKRNNPCSACLGLLQLVENEQYVNKIAEQVVSENFDSDDVTFALTLPITILLRDHSVWLYVSSKYNDYYGESDTISVKKSGKTVSVKEAWKLTTGQKIAEKLNKTVNNGIEGSFHVNIQIEYDMDSYETNCLIDMFPETFKCRLKQKRKFHGEVLTRKSVENSLSTVGMQYFRSFYPIPPRVPDGYAKCGNIDCIKDSIFLAGRYNKYSRNLSQTPWLINGERRMESSVEEIIGKPVSNIMKHDGIKFSSSGREDVDVRTLGKGRPFILEVLNPRKTKLSTEVIRQLEKDINESTKDVFVRDLQIVKKSDLVHIKLGEQVKTKTYNCYCTTKLMAGEKLFDFKLKLVELRKIRGTVIKQKTPIRVLHRRSFAIRPRIVFWVRTEFHEQKENSVFFKLSLQVDAGTYIKEFIHGDFGRTKPNVSELLERDVDILALDVEEIALEWPPSIEYP